MACEKSSGANAFNPLGPRRIPRGIEFRLFSSTAEAVELCLFTSAHANETKLCIELVPQGDGVWVGVAQDVVPGDTYGYRVYGPFVPSQGLRFNPHKLLVDPCARAMTVNPPFDEVLLAYRSASRLSHLSFSPRDSAFAAPRSVIVDESFDWRGDVFPNHPWGETVIYETHVRGMTAIHPEVPPELRGTFLGLVTPPILRHLERLGVTAVELLPVHHSYTEPRLQRLGLTNYWGYSPLGYFAPDQRYSSSAAPELVVREFKEMVRSFHTVGIEVILDVVFNHTAEGNELGPTLAFRGIDNPAYYLLDERDPSRYADFTGCGNTLNTFHPATIDFIVSCLRYWVQEMHVDGFRFDLAGAFRSRKPPYASPLLETIRHDPVLSARKLILEPWDATPEGYALGAFPAPYRQWNDRFRDTVRSFLRGAPEAVPDLATRLAGSSDLFRSSGSPLVGINFITAHDGFTLEDLVSYAEKYNAENFEENRDGSDDNRSQNCGVEGPTDDQEVLALRDRMKRNAVTLLLLSSGVPMLLGGDELCRPQHGNNNRYCHDDNRSWFHWSHSERVREFQKFVITLVQLRRELPFLREDRFATGAFLPSKTLRDVVWLNESGAELVAEDWRALQRARLAVHRSWVDERHGLTQERSILLLLNLEPTEHRFSLPKGPTGWWTVVVDTAEGTTGLDRLRTYRAGEQLVQVGGRSIVVLLSELPAVNVRPS